MDQLVEYIRDRIKAGEQVSEIVARLKAQGWSDADISQAFQKSMGVPAENTAPPVPVPPAQTQSPSPAQTAQPAGRKIDATRIFVIIGTILVIAAIIAAEASKWYDVGPFGKVCFMGLPMLALFAIAFSLSRKEALREYSIWAQAIGYFILPFFLGTVFLQYHLIKSFDARLFEAIFGICLLVYLATEYLFKKYPIAVFSLVALFGLVVSFCARGDLEAEAIAWILLLLAVVILVAGYQLARNQVPNHKFYVTFGTIAVMATSPAAILISLNSPNYLQDETNLVIFSLFGLAYLGLASAYNRLRQQYSESLFYGLKRFAEELAIWVIILPYLFIGDYSSGYLLVALVLSFLGILLSLKVWINSLLYIGAIGLLVSILMLSSQVFSDSIGWPVMVLIAGFVIIGIGLGIKKIVGLRKLQASNEMMLGLGKDPSYVNAHAPSTGKITFWIIGSILGLIMLWRGAIWLYDLYWMSRYEEETPSYDTEVQVDDTTDSNYSSQPLEATSVVKEAQAMTESSPGYLILADSSAKDIRFTIDSFTDYFIGESPATAEQIAPKLVAGAAVKISYTKSGSIYYADKIYFLSSTTPGASSALQAN